MICWANRISTWLSRSSRVYILSQVLTVDEVLFGVMRGAAVFSCSRVNILAYSGRNEQRPLRKTLYDVGRSLRRMSR